MVFILGAKIPLNLQNFIVDGKNYLFLVQKPAIIYVLQLAKTVIKIAKKLFCVHYDSLLCSILICGGIFEVLSCSSQDRVNFCSSQKGQGWSGSGWDCAPW